jgi:hypothetical protein
MQQELPMTNDLDHVPALPGCAAAAEEFSEAEMNNIVGGTTNQRSSGTSANEAISFEYGALVIRYGR